MKDSTNLQTKNENTWCPGCVNFLIKSSVENALKELIEQNKINKKEFVSVADIGCGAKIFEYLDISGINSLHGRVLPTCLGIKVANPNLKVLGFGGDGGTYNEGIAHLIHSCRYNSDFNMFVFNNQIFALTVGQATASTEPGFKEKTHPEGVKEPILNPIIMALEAGASFVARINSFDIKHSKEIIKKAIQHKGFSFIEFLQPCIKFHDFSDIIKKNSYAIDSTKIKTREDAIALAKQWNYDIGKIPVGIFIEEERTTFEDNYKTGFSERNKNLKLIK